MSIIVLFYFVGKIYIRNDLRILLLEEEKNSSRQFYHLLYFILYIQW